MKAKTLLVISSFIGFLAATSAVKVDICHNVDNNPHTITVALPAACAHIMMHSGDKFGTCDEPENSDAR